MYAELILGASGSGAICLRDSMDGTLKYAKLVTIYVTLNLGLCAYQLYVFKIQISNPETHVNTPISNKKAQQRAAFS